MTPDLPDFNTPQTQTTDPLPRNTVMQPTSFRCRIHKTAILFHFSPPLRHQNILCLSNGLANVFLSMPVASIRTRIIKVKLPSESRIGLIVAHMPYDLCDGSTASETGLDEGSFTEPCVTDGNEVFCPTHADQVGARGTVDNSFEASCTNALMRSFSRFRLVGTVACRFGP